MNLTGNGSSAFPLRILLFSAGGIRFGAFAEQAPSMSAWTGGADAELLWFHRRLNLTAPSGAAARPVVAEVRVRGDLSARVLMDDLEEIVEVEAAQIRPLPPLIERASLAKGLWGVLLRRNRPILLVDFQRMERN